MGEPSQDSRVEALEREIEAELKQVKSVLAKVRAARVDMMALMGPHAELLGSANGNESNG